MQSSAAASAADSVTRPSTERDLGKRGQRVFPDALTGRGRGRGVSSQLSVMAAGNAHIGKPAPDFQATAVVDGAFKEVKLSDYRGKGGLERTRVGAGSWHSRCGALTPGLFPPPSPGKYVVLFFYPLDFTFVCPTEIIAFSEHAEDFRKLGCEVLGVSVDSQFTHLAWY